MNRNALLTLSTLSLGFLFATPASAGTYYSCKVDLVANTNTCAATSGVTVSHTTTTAGGGTYQATAVIDLKNYSSRQALIKACYGSTISGWSLHLGDSPSNDGNSGDASNRMWDAETQVLNNTISVYASDNGSAKLLESDSSAVAASQCVTFNAADGHIGWLNTSASTPYYNFTSAPGMLYALDDQYDLSTGSNEAQLYLGMNRTYGSASRYGYGLTSVTLVLY